MTRSSSPAEPVWARRHAAFEGGAEALAETLGALTRELSLEGPEPTPRLVRYYVAEEVLDRPERRGKEALYGFRHIAQFVAARVLLGDGWPLRKIAEDLRDRTREELVALAPQGGASVPAGPSAAELVRDFKATSAIRERQFEAASRKTRIASTLSSLSSPGAPAAAPPTPREALRIDLTDRIMLLVDPAALDGLTDAQAQDLGAATRDMLLDARRRRGSAS